MPASASSRFRSSVAALTLVEVMIAICVLVIAAFGCITTWVSFHGVQGEAETDTKVHRLAQLLVERVQGANWSQLGVWKDDGTQDKTHNALLWHRRYTPRLSSGCTVGYDSSSVTTWSTSTPQVLSPRLPPLEESAKYNYTLSGVTYHDHDLRYLLATADQRVAYDANPTGNPLPQSGISNLKVYLEYYTSTMLEGSVMAASSSANPTLASSNWVSQTEGTAASGPASDQYILHESPGGGVGSYASDPNYFMPPTSKALVIRILILYGANSSRRFETIVVRRK